MLVREIMSNRVISVRVTAPVKQAAQLLSRHSITAMPVLDEDDRLVGVLSEADVIPGVILDDARAHALPVQPRSEQRPGTVADVMTRQVLSVPPQADVAQVADLMASKAIKSMPVVDHGRVVGMVSRGDIVAQLARRDGKIRSEIDGLFRDSHASWSLEVQDGVVVVDGPVTDDEREFAVVLVSTVPGVVGLRFAADEDDHAQTG